MLDNLQRLWRDARPGARLGLATGALVIALLITWTLTWVFQRDDQPLFTELSAEDTATLVTELDRLKLPYRLSADGSTILVDRQQVHTTRMTLMGKGVNLRGGVGFEIFANNDFGMTDFAQRINYQRALQGELTRTIAALEEVRHVRVHLVLPESGLFRKSSVKPKAAVTLALRRGRALGPAQVLGIQRLVAAAVPEIEPGAVTIVDDTGLTLSRAADPEGELGSEARVGAKSEIEQYVARKAVAVLDRAFGPGRAIVSVDITLDYNQVRVTREDVLPGNPRSGDGALTRRRSSQTGAPAGGGSLAAGDEAPRAGASSSELEFQNGRRVEQVVTRPGGVRQISVGILLPHALPADRAEELKRVISAAVGLNPGRGDELAISSLDQFSGAGVPAAAAASAAAAATASRGTLTAMDAAPRSAAAAGEPHALWAPSWWWALAALVLAGLAAAGAWWWSRRTRAPPLTAAAREDMLRQMRQWLAEEAPPPVRGAAE